MLLLFFYRYAVAKMQINANFMALHAQISSTVWKLYKKSKKRLFCIESSFLKVLFNTVYVCPFEENKCSTTSHLFLSTWRMMVAEYESDSRENIIQVLHAP